MNASAIATSWSVRVRWGDRRLHAETLDGDGRRKLKLGKGEHTDVELGADVQAELEWTEVGLKVALSSGFTGKVALQGDRSVPLSSLVSRGRAREEGDSLVMLLDPRDAMTLHVGSLDVMVAAAKQPVRRLPFDLRVLSILALGLLAVGLIFASILF